MMTILAPFSVRVTTILHTSSRILESWTHFSDWWKQGLIYGLACNNMEQQHVRITWITHLDLTTFEYLDQMLKRKLMSIFGIPADNSWQWDPTWSFARVIFGSVKLAEPQPNVVINAQDKTLATVSHKTYWTLVTRIDLRHSTTKQTQKHAVIHLNNSSWHWSSTFVFCDSFFGGSHTTNHTNLRLHATNRGTKNGNTTSHELSSWWLFIRWDFLCIQYEWKCEYLQANTPKRIESRRTLISRGSTALFVHSMNGTLV